jgi:hypothetical protein
MAVRIQSTMYLQAFSLHGSNATSRGGTFPSIDASLLQGEKPRPRRLVKKG